MEYALLALSELDGHGPIQALSAREIADRMELPYDTLAKILKSLNQAQWLKSVQGAKGGYLLAVDLNLMSYLQLAQVLEEKIETLDCNEPDGCSHVQGCQISAPLRAIDHLLHSFFQSLPIKALISGQDLLPNWADYLKGMTPIGILKRPPTEELSV